MPSKLHFRVIHASGQDDLYKASELNHHSPVTKGWQSARFCLYPQDIVIQLESRSRIRKIQILAHQFLVPTKIEFFVGDVPDGTDLSLDSARYARLGYVSLSDNEKTGFKARELKSVHVDAVGHYLKLNIHKNHVNKHNLYNQVGIVAINVIGDELRKHNLTDPDVLLDDDRVEKDPTLEGFFNRPDYISPLDDLAFDMYQDPEIAQIIRRLERKKQEAVHQERYDYAKKLKSAITELQKVGEKLGKMEVEKRQAVENEDYDKAKLKKVQMDEYRLQVYQELDLNSLLELSGSRHPMPVDLEPTRQPTPPRLVPLSPPPLEPTPRSPPRYDDRPLPKRPATLEEELEPESDQQEPEPMSEVDLREASTAIEVFGLSLVSKAYSKTWSYREDALTAVYRQMQELPVGSKDDAKSNLRAAIFLVKRGIDDKVYAVFKAALNLLRMIQTEFIPKHKLGKTDVVYTVEKSLQNLFHKTGDTAARNRDDAKNFVYEMAEFREVKPTNAVCHECVKPFKLTLGPRFAESRCEMLETLYKKFNLKNGLTMNNVMEFNKQALQHNAMEVREVAERLVRQMYKDHGAPVKDYLPQDDEKARKNTQLRMLFEYFDEVDGKPSKADLKKQKADEEAKKQAEIDALQKQLHQLREMNAGKAPVDPGVLKGEAAKKAPIKKKPDKSKPKKAKDDDDVSMFTVDNTCIFCGERDESFTEEGLDLHYWKSCPMLKRCSNCKQVVEIATYTEHQLSECEAKGNFGKCPRCTEAIPKPEYDQHVAEKTCNPSKAGSNHCPLCHENIPSGEDGWKEHLMGRTGCKQNPRRLLALNKTGGTKGAGRGRGRGGAATRGKR